MDKQNVKGIIVPIITPTAPDESIDEKQLRVQVNRMIDAGIHGIFCFGTTGEGYALDMDEKRRILEIVVAEVNSRVPVYAGTGCIRTRDTVVLSMYAEECGADVLSIITPSFAAISQEQLYEHYREVARSVDLPIVAYNIPARTGVSIEPETWRRLTRLENIAGIKDSSGSFHNMLEYIEQARGTGCAVLSGNDSLILWNLLAGGSGGIAGCANVYPKTLAELYLAFCKGEIEKAKELQNSLRSLRSCFQYGNPSTIIKTAVSLLGFPVGKCRQPFAEVSREGLEEIKRVLTENTQKGMC